MAKKITFFVASNTGAQMKQLTVSRVVLTLLSIPVIVVFVVISLIMFDYVSLKHAHLKTKTLENTISGQCDELENQRKQIKIFANEINAFKTKIVDLNSFEEKIRIIANIEKTSEQDSLFGVGGSIPEDLDAGIPLTEKHNSLLREMHDQVDQLELVSIKQKEGFVDLLKYLENKRNLLASTPAIRPIKGGWVTSRFGYRKSPFTGGREFHSGLDIGTRKGVPVKATADGVVAYAGRKGLLGKVIVLDHGHGMVTRYGHLSKTLKERGDIVKRGEIVGEVGNTGRSTGPHVHYEVRLNGIPVNPEKYILN